MDLTKEQIDQLEAAISRRMNNTGESRSEACKHIRDYLLSRFDGEAGPSA